MPESETKKNGVSGFKRRLARLDVCLLVLVRHPQTNGNLERLHGEIERYLHEFEVESADRTATGPHDGHMDGPFHTTPMMMVMMVMMDATDRFMGWYNHDRAHRP